VFHTLPQEERQLRWAFWSGAPQSRIALTIVKRALERFEQVHLAYGLVQYCSLRNSVFRTLLQEERQLRRLLWSGAPQGRIALMIF
jgi:hypothetical protein